MVDAVTSSYRLFHHRSLSRQQPPLLVIYYLSASIGTVSSTRLCNISVATLKIQLLGWDEWSTQLPHLASSPCFPPFGT